MFHRRRLLAATTALAFGAHNRFDESKTSRLPAPKEKYVVTLTVWATAGTTMAIAMPMATELSSQRQPGIGKRAAFIFIASS